MEWCNAPLPKLFNMTTTKIIITGLCFFIYVSGFSQGDSLSLSLDESIRIALENNLELQRVELSERRSNVNFRRAKSNLLPDINGNYNLGLSSGRSIDPYTNQYINRELTFSNAGLGANLNIFSGFQALNRIKQTRLNLQASQMELEEAKQNLILDVTLAYLQVLNQKDLVQLANNRLETTREQVNRLRNLYEEEVGNPADFTDIQGQSAIDRTNLIQSENSLRSALLDLTQLLNIDRDIKVEDIVILREFEIYPFTPEQIFAEALDNLATFKARELRVEAAQKGVQVARSSYIPTISLFGQLNTNYSSAAQIFLETGTRRVETGGIITIDGQEIPVMTDQTIFAQEGITYNDQFSNNLNSIVGVSVRVPILNGLEVRNNVALEKINHQEAIVIQENTRLQFRQSIEQAYYDMMAANSRYEILQEQVEAYEESFRINEIRFNSGVSTIVEYTISKNNLDNARINLANARYEYLLRVKVLEYYRGVD